MSVPNSAFAVLIAFAFGLRCSGLWAQQPDPGAAGARHSATNRTIRRDVNLVDVLFTVFNQAQ